MTLDEVPYILLSLPNYHGHIMGRSTPYTATLDWPRLEVDGLHKARWLIYLFEDGIQIGVIAQANIGIMWCTALLSMGCTLTPAGYYGKQVWAASCHGCDKSWFWSWGLIPNLAGHGSIWWLAGAQCVHQPHSASLYVVDILAQYECVLSCLLSGKLPPGSSKTVCMWDEIRHQQVLATSPEQQTLQSF